MQQRINCNVAISNTTLKVAPAGLEPTVPRLKAGCFAQLSYEAVISVTRIGFESISPESKSGILTIGRPGKVWFFDVGREGRDRTRNLWFWRPLLYQLNYFPVFGCLLQASVSVAQMGLEPIVLDHESSVLATYTTVQYLGIGNFKFCINGYNSANSEYPILSIQSPSCGNTGVEPYLLVLQTSTLTPRALLPF